MPDTTLITRISLVLLIFALAIQTAVAETAADTPTEAPSLEILSFLVGSWRGATHDMVTEELWMPARGGLMLGLNRSVSSRGTQWELLRIEVSKDDAGIVYWASPGGDGATPFRLIEHSENRAVFANPDHDFPQRLIYTRSGSTLHARVEAGEGVLIRGFDLSWQLIDTLN